MSDTRDAKLAAKVKAVNGANEYARRLHADLAELFRPSVGQKVIREDGGLMARIAKELVLPRFMEDSRLHVFRSSSDYSLSWTVKACEMVEGACGCVYHETGVYVGNLRDGFLTELHPAPELRSNYTADEIRAARQKYKEAARAADDARSALYPFGESDN